MQYIHTLKGVNFPMCDHTCIYQSYNMRTQTSVKPTAFCVCVRT